MQVGELLIQHLDYAFRSDDFLTEFLPACQKLLRYFGRVYLIKRDHIFAEATG